jgi:cobalt-precorrin 5A hydrolase/precorrin-3B C17-methyltransferase
MTRTSDAPVPAISDTTSRARVYFIGAGPGDPELLTLKAQRLIASADLILYAGSLVNPAVLHHARPEARRHNSAGMPLDEQIALMRRAVETGQTVVRLHTGDPSVFGAIMEQMQALDRLGIAYEIVPGVSSVFAAAAALGIELTLPESTQTVILTRLGGQTPTPASEALRDLAAHRTSLAIFLSVGMLERVVEELLAAGYPPDAPIAVVFRASWPDQRVVRATLRTIVAQVRDAEITHQALIIVGPPLALPSGDQPGARSHLYGGATQPPQREPTRAIVTLTRAGTRTGLRLLAGLPDCVLYAPTRHLPDSSVTAGNGDIRPYDVAVRQVLQDAFHRHSGLVCIMASGIVVRDLAPLLGSKHTDPGVVVVDTAGRYAVSLLAGHVGGGNRLAHEVAACLGGDAVVTTASDVHDLPALDLLGPTYGWTTRRWRAGRTYDPGDCRPGQRRSSGRLAGSGKLRLVARSSAGQPGPLCDAGGAAGRRASGGGGHQPSARARQLSRRRARHDHLPATRSGSGGRLQPQHTGRRNPGRH